MEKEKGKLNDDNGMMMVVIFNDNDNDNDDDYNGNDNYGGFNDHNDNGNDSPIQFILFKFLLQTLKSSFKNLGSTNQNHT